MANNQKLTHLRPQMTVAALADYVTTTDPSRRTTICKEEKYYDSVSQPPYYRETRINVTRFLNGQPHDDDALKDASSRIDPSTGTSDNERTRLTLNRNALLSLHECRKDFWTTELPYIAVPTAKHLMLDGVKVILSPHVLLSGTYRGVDSAGLLKLHLSTKVKLDDNMADYIGAISAHYLQEQLSNQNCSPCHTLLVDVFRKKCFRAPNATIKRMKSLRIACQVVADTWHRI